MSTPGIKLFDGVDVPEGSDAEYEATFVGADADETVLVPAAVSKIEATLKRVDGTVINSRSAQSVLNTSGGTLAAGGVFTLMLGAADNAIAAGFTGTRELHILTLHIEYTRVGGGTGVLNREVRYWVRNLAHIGT